MKTQRDGQQHETIGTTGAAGGPHRTGRRELLRTVGGATLGLGGLVALSGCLAEAEEAPYPTPTAPASVPTAQVPVGGGTILSDAPYVVTQPSAGEYKAFSAICTHQRCPVQEIQDRDILCLCHGSKFSIVDGSVDRGPAQRPLPEFSTSVQDGEVHIDPTGASAAPATPGASRAPRSTPTSASPTSRSSSGG